MFYWLVHVLGTIISHTFSTTIDHDHDMNAAIIAEHLSSDNHCTIVLYLYYWKLDPITIIEIFSNCVSLTITNNYM